MAEAYKLKADASFPQPLLEDEEGNAVTVVGRTYNAQDYILATDLTKRDRERAESGELDHLLEAASKEDAEAAQAADQRLVLIPEHEAEAVVLAGDPNKEIVPRDQVVELGSAGAEEAQKAQEEAKADGADERPALTAAEVPSLADNERGEGNELGVVPKDSEKVDEERLAGVERPPGVMVGPDKEAAEGGGQSSVSAVTRRARPGRPAAQEEAARTPEAQRGAQSPKDANK
jgi:hypothetical protein